MAGNALWSGLEGAATVAQLVGVDFDGLIYKIEQAAVTARQNKEECEHLAAQVGMITDLLQPLLPDPEATRTLVSLGDALRDAHELVQSCQGKGGTYRFFTASRQALRFRDVQSRIGSFLILFPEISYIYRARRLGLRLYQPAVSREELEEAERFTLAEITAATGNFAVVLGQGDSGTVYRGKLRDGREVAVKRLKDDGLRSAEDTFDTELAILHPVSHEHVVRLLGFCAEEGERLLVYQRMDNGTLRDHLDASPDPAMASWTWKIRVGVLLGAARAIKHLHCRNIPLLIHSNVTSSNILLDRSWTPHLSGFGSSVWRAPDVESLAVYIVQTYGYADPEYCSTGRLKPATDLYSLGVVMLEVLTGNQPVVDMWEETKKRMVGATLVSWALPSIEAGQLGDVLDRRLASAPTPRQREVLKLVASMAASCLRLHGDNRPAIADVVATLEKAHQLICNDKMATHGSATHNCSNDQSSEPESLAFQYLKQITNSFSAERVLRSGIFGVVYAGKAGVSEGVLQNEEMIAVKKLVVSKPGFQRDFETECRRLMKLKHPNIARYVGYSYKTHKICLQSDGKTGVRPIFVEMAERLLCSEYSPKGSTLDMYLSDESSGFDWQARYKIILGICNGLHYLQEETDHQPILHLDLKPTNIMLDDNMIPKIMDFGISRLFPQEQTVNTLGSNETLSYMAPEYIHGGAVTLKSDIFSLGVIMLEVITGRRGFPDVNIISSEDFIELADEILKTTLEKAQPHALKELDCQGIKRCIQTGLICVNLQKTKRPTVKTILKMLHGLQNIDCHYSNEIEMSSFGVTAPLLRKLDSLLPPEYRVPKPLADEIDLLKENLEEISAALLEQSMVDVPNKMGKLWMGEARELSYDIEEFIDNMMQRLQVTAPGRRRKMRCVQTYRVGRVKISWLPKALKPSAKITEFRTLLREASDRYYRYLDGCTTSSRCVLTAHGQNPVLYAKAPNYLVGIDDTKTKLVRCLIDKEQQQLKVVPIVGPAGVGKTTLAKQVYREVGMEFDCRAFVRASRKPDMRRLLGGVLSQVQRRPGLSGSLTVQDLIDNLTEYLQDKRYIIVIDDLWETTACDILISAFPEGNNRSRIIITAEFESVALGYCDDESNNILKMKPLGRKDSGNLFFNLVFGPETQCPEQMKDVSDIIIAKCSGLPLATICVAGLLASQRDNSELWQHVQQCLCSSLSTNSSLEETLQEIMKLSYNSTPYYLKTCLMYLGMYPEGHTLWKVDLVNLWIAEDMISATEGENTEEVAESYFSELVNRGLIQPVDITYNGDVLSCTVNHVVLELIARDSSEDKFITTLDYSQTITGLYSNARRLSLQFSNARYATKPKGLTLSKVRSFAFFGIIKCMPSIVELKQLRVLILKFWGDHPESTIFDLTEICLLFQLRYLKISCDADVEVKLPTQMQILRYMETLIVDAKVPAVPLVTIHLPGSLRTLHYIYSDSNSEGNVFSLGELQNLQDLHITYYAEKSDEHLKRNLTGLASSIGKLVKLKSFTLSPGASDRAIYTDLSSSRSCPSVFLQRLELLAPICIFTRLPEWIGQLRKLSTLEIGVCVLVIKDMDMLAGLPTLTSLSLYVRKLTTGKIIFKRGEFPALKYFKYTYDELSLAFQKEALPNLQRLELNFNAHRGEQYDNLLAGIEFMLNLKEIAGTIGEAPGAEIRDRMAANSALNDAIRKHPRLPKYHIVNIADCVEKDCRSKEGDSSDEHSRIQRKETKEDTKWPSTVGRGWAPAYQEH